MHMRPPPVEIRPRGGGVGEVWQQWKYTSCTIAHSNTNVGLNVCKSVTEWFRNGPVSVTRNWRPSTTGWLQHQQWFIKESRILKMRDVETWSNQGDVDRSSSRPRKRGDEQSLRRLLKVNKNIRARESKFSQIRRPGGWEVSMIFFKTQKTKVMDVFDF